MTKPGLKKLLFQIAAACFLVSLAWLLQAMGFRGEDGATSQVVWSLTAALVFGFGIGFCLIGSFWCA